MKKVAKIVFIIFGLFVAGGVGFIWHVRNQLEEGDRAYRNMLTPGTKANQEFAASVAESAKANAPLDNGVSLLRQGKLEEAMVEFNKYPDESTRHVYIADTYEKLGMYDEALNHVAWLYENSKEDWYKEDMQKWTEKLKAEKAKAAAVAK